MGTRPGSHELGAGAKRQRADAEGVHGLQIAPRSQGVEPVRECEPRAEQEKETQYVEQAAHFR